MSASEPPWLIETFDLPIEHERLTVPVGFNVDRLPAEFRAALDSRHVSCNMDLQRKLAALARQCSLSGMREWLRQMSQGGRFELRVFRGREWTGELVTDACFVIEPLEPKVLPASVNLWCYRPATGESTAHLPKPLDHIYDLIDGIGNGCPRWMSSGLVPFHDLENRLGCGEPFQGYKPRCNMLQNVVAFWSAGTGDYEFVDHNHAIWFDHETLTLKDDGPLSEYMDRYFRSLVE